MSRHVAATARLKDVLHTFASVSAFQTIGMMLLEENVDPVESIQVEVMVRT